VQDDSAAGEQVRSFSRVSGDGDVCVVGFVSDFGIRIGFVRVLGVAWEVDMSFLKMRRFTNPESLAGIDCRRGELST